MHASTSGLPSRSLCIQRLSSKGPAGLFGSDEVTADVMYPPIFGMTRHWHSFSEISDETDNARVWGGIHTRHACTDGAELAVQVAECCLANYMKPVN